MQVYLTLSYAKTNLITKLVPALQLEVLGWDQEA